MTISATAVDVLPVYMDSIHDGEYIYAKNQQLGYNQNKHQLIQIEWLNLKLPDAHSNDSSECAARIYGF